MCACVCVCVLGGGFEKKKKKEKKGQREKEAQAFIIRLFRTRRDDRRWEAHAHSPEPLGIRTRYRNIYSVRAGTCITY